MSGINIRSAFAAASLLAIGCAHPKTAARPTPPRAPDVAVTTTTAPSPNLEVRVREVVERAELDGLAYAKVFVDGALAGQTPTAPRSQEKVWQGRVDPGNHPVRFELWVLPGLGAWQPLPASEQPRERFVRLEAGSLTRVELRRAAGGRYNVDVSREPL